MTVAEFYDRLTPFNHLIYGDREASIHGRRAIWMM